MKRVFLILTLLGLSACGRLGYDGIDPNCGNGTLDEGEAGDGCSPKCVIEGA